MNITRLILMICGVLFYFSNLLLNGEGLGQWANYTIGNKTVVYFPVFTTYQFTIIQTIPLFILVLIGMKNFILILKLIDQKQTPFTEEIVSIFKRFTKTILFFGVIKMIISVFGTLTELTPTNVFSFDVAVIIFPVEYVLASFMTLGVAYILNTGLKIKTENDMFV